MFRQMWISPLVKPLNLLLLFILISSSYTENDISISVDVTKKPYELTSKGMCESHHYQTIYKFRCNSTDSTCHLFVRFRTLNLGHNSNISIYTEDSTEELKSFYGPAPDLTSGAAMLKTKSNILHFIIDLSHPNISCSNFEIEIGRYKDAPATSGSKHLPTALKPGHTLPTVKRSNDDTRYLYVLYTTGPLLLLTLVGCIYYKMNSQASNYHRNLVELFRQRNLQDFQDYSPPSYATALAQPKPEVIPFSTLPAYEDLHPRGDPPPYEVNDEIVLNIANLENVPKESTSREVEQTASNSDGNHLQPLTLGVATGDEQSPLRCPNAGVGREIFHDTNSVEVETQESTPVIAREYWKSGNLRSSIALSSQTSSVASVAVHDTQL